MRLETTTNSCKEPVEMSAALERVMAAAGLGMPEEENENLAQEAIFSDLGTTCLAKRGRDVEDEDDSDDEEEDDFDDEDEEDDFDDEDEDDEEEEEEDFDEEFDDDDLDDDDDIFYDDDDDE